MAQPERGVTVATYTDYGSAQRAVDYLADSGFPVDGVTIIGTDLRTVEQVLRRMTIGRAALAGAGTGAWFGLLIGLLFGIFSISQWWKVLLFAVVAGALWGAVFGALAHGMTRGQRDFVSRQSLQAADYTVTATAEHATRARDLLAGAALRTNPEGGSRAG